MERKRERNKKRVKNGERERKTENYKGEGDRKRQNTKFHLLGVGLLSLAGREQL